MAKKVVCYKLYGLQTWHVVLTTRQGVWPIGRVLATRPISTDVEQNETHVLYPLTCVLPRKHIMLTKLCGCFGQLYC